MDWSAASRHTLLPDRHRAKRNRASRCPWQPADHLGKDPHPMRTHFLLVRVFAFLALLLFAPQVYAQDPLVCQLAGKQAKCPGNAMLPAGTITSASLPAAGTAGIRLPAVDYNRCKRSRDIGHRWFSLHPTERRHTRHLCQPSVGDDRCTGPGNCGIGGQLLGPEELLRRLHRERIRRWQHRCTVQDHH